MTWAWCGVGGGVGGWVGGGRVSYDRVTVALLVSVCVSSPTGAFLYCCVQLFWQLHKHAVKKEKFDFYPVTDTM